MKYRLLIGAIGIVVIVGVAFIVIRNIITPPPVMLIEPVIIENSSLTQYLAIQIYTRTADSPELERNLGPSNDLATTVTHIIDAVGSTGDSSRRLAFFVGPIAFDNTDADVAQLIRESFQIALDKNIAVGFHIDDSMFWRRLSSLNTSDNIEWLDWNKTLTTGRRVDWSSTPTMIMPQLCLNSPAVKEAVEQRAALIGAEVSRGIEALQAAGKPELFAGVIAGWETRMGKDFDTNASLGYCALTNEGYSASNPPADIDEARVQIIQDFIDFWATSLFESGVPETKIFSHIATQAFVGSGNPTGSYLVDIDFSPVRVAFGPRHYAGFSTYPDLNILDEVQAERAKLGNPPWASAEGTPVRPSQAFTGSIGDPMEGYLGSFFNHGAVLVNLYGWEVGDANSPFRRAVEGADAIAAYQKFLRGETLRETVSIQGSSPAFSDKVLELQTKLPPYFEMHGNNNEVGVLYKDFQQQVSAQDFGAAEKTIDAILAIITAAE